MVWLDADTIVKCDIVNMARSALTNTNYAIAAVSMEKSPIGLLPPFKTNISRTFNNGVMVVDLERWREKGLTGKIEAWVQRNREEKIYKLGCQPVRPVVCTDHYSHHELLP